MTENSGPSRILEVAPEDMTAAQKEGVEALLAGRGRLLAPYKIWMHSPGLMKTMAALGTFLNKQSTLSEREVEFGICLAARHWAGDYVFESHAAKCLGLGVPRPVIEALRDGEEPDLPDPREHAIYDLSRLAAEEGPGSDERFDRIVKALGRDGLAEVICLLGYYSSVAIGMKLHRVPAKPRA